MTEFIALTGFEGQDLRTLIDARASLRGAHPWMIWEPFSGESRQWTYSAFQVSLRRFAAGLCARGVRPGDRVLVHLANSPESVIAWLGCAYAGAIAVTTNAGSSRAELAYFAEHSRAVAAITQPQFAELVRAAAPSIAWLAVTEFDSDGTAPLRSPPNALQFSDIDADPDILPSRSYEPLSPFCIQYTSGTTSRPKAVLWTHANALWGAKLSALHEGLHPEDIHLVHLPLFHTNAQVYSVLASLWAGATIVVQPRFSASRFWSTATKHCCTVTSVVPFCIKALNNHPVPDEHHFRLWGAAFSDGAVEARYRVKTIGWWGMTETVSHGIVGSTFGPNADYSMGTPSPGYQIVLRNDDGTPTAAGDVGNLFVRGRRGVSLFLEYAENPEATVAAFPEPDLLATGDRVRMDGQGFLYFADRDKDVLKVGGENVSASEVERVIGQVPGVSEVAVVGQPDEMFDEVPVAFIIATEPGEMLRDHILRTCQDQLSPFKRPRAIHFVEQLPRSTLEKVSKADLRARLQSQAHSKVSDLSRLKTKGRRS